MLNSSHPIWPDRLQDLGELISSDSFNPYSESVITASLNALGIAKYLSNPQLLNAFVLGSYDRNWGNIITYNSFDTLIELRK